MQKVKKLSQKIFKGFFKFIFKIFYGNIIYEENNLNSKEIEIKLITNVNIVSFFKKKYKVYKIDNARVYTDNVENVAVINNNKILDNISYQQQSGYLNTSEKNICIKNGTPRIKKKIKGRVLSLVQGASGNSNYYHWLFDMLPKIKLYSEIYDLKDLNYIYTNKLKDFQITSLNPLGLDKIEVIDSEKYRHIQADEVVCTDHPSYFSGYISDQSKHIPIWIVKWLRNVFLECAMKFQCNDKVFIDRSSASSKHCQFINQGEISEFLINKGFTKYKIENLNFFEQIYLFNNSSFLFGAHGAGFANLVFCKKKTKVIEIRPTNHPSNLYEKLSEINDLNYKLIKTEEAKNDKNFNGDIFLDINKLKNII